MKVGDLLFVRNISNDIYSIIEVEDIQPKYFTALIHFSIATLKDNTYSYKKGGEYLFLDDKDINEIVYINKDNIDTIFKTFKLLL